MLSTPSARADHGREVRARVELKFPIRLRTGMRRDITRLMRRLSDAFRAQARPAEMSGRNHGGETGAQAIVTTAPDLPPGPRSRPSMTSAILSFTAGPSGSTKQQDMSRSSEAVY